MQAHPWFTGVEWDKLYEIEAAFKPEVNGELDTQNFEKFEEVLIYSFFNDIFQIPVLLGIYQFTLRSINDFQIWLFSVFHVPKQTPQ